MRSPLEHSASLLSTMILALAVVACGQVDSGDTDETDGEGAGGAGTGGGGQAKPDLFACELPVDCTMDVGHLGESVTPEMMKCQSDLALSGEHGVQRHLSNPGPYPTHTESLTVFLGDGTAIYQSRSRCASVGACGEQNTTEWQRSDLQRCDVVPVDVESPSQCGEGEEQCVYPKLENCVVIGLDFTCDDATP